MEKNNYLFGRLLEMLAILTENIRYVLWNSKILRMKRIFVILNFINLFSWIICMRIYFPHGGHISFSEEKPEFAIICLIIWFFLTILGLLIFNVYFFYHWSMTKFKSKNIKKNWLAILFFSVCLSGGIISLIYYIFVIEMKYGISKDCNTTLKT